MQTRNTLAHIVNYEKTIFFKNDNILVFKRAYDMKISQSIIYVKDYFYLFFSTLRDIIHISYHMAPNKV